MKCVRNIMDCFNTPGWSRRKKNTLKRESVRLQWCVSLRFFFYSHWFSVQHEQCIYFLQWIVCHFLFFCYFNFICSNHESCASLVCSLRFFFLLHHSGVPVGALTIQFRLYSLVSFFNLCQLKIHKGKISSLNLEMGNKDSLLHTHTQYRKKKYLQRKIIFASFFLFHFCQFSFYI